MQQFGAEYQLCCPQGRCLCGHCLSRQLQAGVGGSTLTAPPPSLPLQAAKLCPSDPLVAHELGVLAYRNRQYEAAAGWLRRALALVPGGRPTPSECECSRVAVGLGRETSVPHACCPRSAFSPAALIANACGIGVQAGRRRWWRWGTRCASCASGTPPLTATSRRWASSRARCVGIPSVWSWKPWSVCRFWVGVIQPLPASSSRWCSSRTGKSCTGGCIASVALTQPRHGVHLAAAGHLLGVGLHVPPEGRCGRSH